VAESADADADADVVADAGGDAVVVFAEPAATGWV
jgi:hypothetical protein